MAAALLYYWRFKETIGDGRQLVNAVLAALSRLSLPVRAQTLLTAGFLAGWYAGGSQAEAIGNESLTLCRELDDRYGVLHSLLLLGLSLLQQQHGRARPILEQALVQCRELGDRDVLGDILIYLGRAEAATGETASAIAHLEEGLLLARERGDRLLITLALRGQAYLAALLRDFERAQTLLE